MFYKYKTKPRWYTDQFDFIWIAYWRFTVRADRTSLPSALPLNCGLISWPTVAVWPEWRRHFKPINWWITQPYLITSLFAICVYAIKLKAEVSFFASESNWKRGGEFRVPLCSRGPGRRGAADRHRRFRAEADGVLTGGEINEPSDEKSGEAVWHINEDWWAAGCAFFPVRQHSAWRVWYGWKTNARGVFFLLLLLFKYTTIVYVQHDGTTTAGLLTVDEGYSMRTHIFFW